MIVKFHKRPTEGKGQNGTTVNSHRIDFSVNGEKIGYIFKSVGSIWFNCRFTKTGSPFGGEFLKLKDAKACAIRGCETNKFLQDNDTLSAEVIA